MSIESKHFVANATDIQRLTESILDGDAAATEGRGTYMSALVGTIQHELGSPPRMRSATAPKLSEEDVAAHLKALRDVYTRFHEAVVRAVKARMTRYDAEYVRSKTRFSVSAASTVRSYIRAGNDIRALAASRVTKEGLATPRARRKYTPENLQRRAVTLGEALVAVARNLHAANRALATEVLQPILSELANAGGLTEGATRDVDKAIANHVPLHTRTGVLVPVDFAAVSRRRRAA